MSADTHIEVPADGAKIVPGEPTPDNPIIPFIEGDGIGVDITPVMKAVVDAAVEKAYGGARQIHWLEIYAGEKATRVYGSDVWLPDETLDRGARVLGLDQGPADDPDRRRPPLAQRRAAPGARPLRLPAAGALLRRRPEPAARPVADGHGDLPREHRGHLRRDRMGGRDRRRPQGDRLPPERDGRAQDPLPRDVEHRDQAGLARGHRAARAQGDPLRARQRARLGHARPQGQHHEVHRGRLPRLGLRARRARVRRRADRRRARGSRSSTRDARSRSRT